MIKDISRVYLHYPFCTKLCHYCNFSAGVSPRNDFTEIYFNALVKEIEHYKNKYDFQNIAKKSFYLGGGTPSLMPLDQLAKFFEYFTFNKDTEITFEINPETVTLEKARFWYNLGINRVSLGWQTMNSTTLKFLGRTSTPEDNIKSFSILREVGFQNISVDRILSIQNDTNEDFFQAVQQYKPDHVSTYQLSIEDRTVLSLWTKQKKYFPMIDDKAINIEEQTENILSSLGYHRYETSNFALEGKESQHNLGYWDYDYWLGLGSGASGFLPNNDYGLHYNNHFTFNKYCTNPTEYEYSENINSMTAIKETLMLGIRKRSGINKKHFEKRLDVSWNDLFTKKLNSDFFIETEDTVILKKAMIPLTNPAVLELWNSINL